ncbi:asparagine synthase-related protein [Thalassolituus sp. LLYu03]|uniref:asparagine synthase-related protein n=1 Tax=Thalassolituus sp. LLYu03 TaxID=3421656 RepID=UPI003D2AA422
MNLQNEILDILYFGYPLRSCVDEHVLVSNAVTDESTLSKLRSVFLAATERLLGNHQHVILPLSGGLDSRLILGCLLECLPASRIHAFNYGVPGNLDFEIPQKIARATGIHLVQTEFREVQLSPDRLLDSGYTLASAPCHNLIGYTLIQALSETSLGKLGVDASLPVWSGFLGDRIFNEKWKGLQLPLRESAHLFAENYCINSRFAELFPDYDPGARLEDMYRDSDEPVGTTWIERMEYHQRQYRVRSTLMTLPGSYCFLFEQPEVMAQIIGCGQRFSHRGELQTRYFHQFHPKLAALPVTSRFGAALLKYPWQTSLNRWIRLGKNRAGSLPGLTFLKDRNVKISPGLLSAQVRGYDECIRGGLNVAGKALEPLGINIYHPVLSSWRHTRLGAEQMASLGYLHIPS